MGNYGRQKRMGKQPFIHPGNDRFGSWSWKHLEISVCALLKRWGSILHTVYSCNSGYGNTVPDSGVWRRIQFQVIICKGD